MIDPMRFEAALTGRLTFRPGVAPTDEPLPPGRHELAFEEGRATVLVVPDGLDTSRPVPLLVMFHGAGGEANRVLPHLVPLSRKRGFLLMTPQSTYPTWDIVVGGNGPDLSHLDQSLQWVASRFALDPGHLCLAGFSDGGSYALSTGLTNGDVASHVIGLSAGFINSFTQAGAPRIFLAHGRSDLQLPIETSAQPHALKMLEAGHDLTLLPFDGDHVIVPWVIDQAVSFFMGPEAC